ncbi:hypothetical protein FZC35_01890 [Candidatus Cytomitobacter indipagum]|uniref:Penicillin-binding protein 2 n=1 Tax=Candidatus Cytomitobacter indipagum TaxID=2601575 RepID=A0A5C0UDP8_9PROT|nr:penicillin-binding transpeptidase domain-containing protein [Candidatus Cytomitobacter indipagum]QEK38118.1 hypothetical protein FZC35_01890 [Candidatus Cytomitobacter indipagum]
MKSKIVFIFLSILYSIFLFRIISIQKYDKYNAFKNKVEIRKEILDSKGEILAFTAETNSIYCIPNQMNQIGFNFLEKNLQFNAKNINKNGSFVWIKRHISEDENVKIKNDIKKNKVKGILIAKDYKRIYPYSSSTSHITGYCDQNLNGKSGSELAFNEKLNKDKVHLTIDIRIQSILFSIIKDIFEEFESEDSSGIIIDVESGEVRAMASYPSPDPYMPYSYLRKENKNHNLSAIEAGSILKLHNAAMCLENQIVNLDSIVDATGTLQVGKFEVQDFMGQDRKMTFLESVRFSSNIATGRLALEVGAEKQKQFFQKIGFLDPIEWIPNQFARPLAPKKWRKSTIVTASYGYGIGLTSMHIAQGLMRILTGKSKKLSFYSSEPVKSNKIISKHTIESMKIIMRTIIKSSYRSININGYEIGGKTGTANMCENGKYIEERNRVSYLGAFPMQKPKYIFLIQTTNPKKHKLKRGKYLVASNVLAEKVKIAVQEIASIENVEPIYD